jgi:hypothetical protein
MPRTKGPPMIRLESAGPAVALLPRVVTMPQRYALGSAERIEFREADDQPISIYGGEAIAGRQLERLLDHVTPVQIQ